MLNDDLSADEIVLCEKIVLEICDILNGTVQDTNLSIQNEASHYIRLKYYDVLVDVLLDGSGKVGIQGHGSPIKNYHAGEDLQSLLEEGGDDLKDSLRDSSSADWMSRVKSALCEEDRH